MHISRLELTDFRNYVRADVSPCPGIVVLHGDNAQGKTALLEAVYLCCTGRSHRTSRDKELIRFDQPTAHVHVDAVQSDGEHAVDITLNSLTRKTVRVNGTVIGRSGELMGHIMGVLFSPEDLRMVKDGPAERRRFIDMELSQIRPAYYYQLQRYARVLTQRSKLLRDAHFDRSLLATLPSWDEQLAQSGAQVIEYRRAFIEKLHTYAAAIHKGISGDREQLSVSYQASFSSDQSGTQLAEALLSALHQSRERDIERGSTSIGPHRDDILLSLNGVDARVYGSQGQQRSCALSLKLSELEVMKSETGEYPILMLDDVMSELDPMRRRQLLDALSGIQILVTCTDPEDLSGAQVGQMIHVEKGTLGDG